MKKQHTLLGLLCATSFMFSCKDDKATTPTEERIEANQPAAYDNAVGPSPDTTAVIRDSIIDPNMEGQSDTHGRDTDAGR